MSIIETLKKRENLDRIIYTAVILAFVIPYLNPIGLPITISDRVRDAYLLIEDLPAGSIILMDCNWAGWGELTAGTYAIFDHIMSRPLKLIILSCDNPDTVPPIAQLLTEQDKLKHNKVYGTDFVYLGFTPGWETMIAELAQNPRAVYRKDYWGTPTDELPLMLEFNSYKDIDLIISLGGKHVVRYYIYQWASTFGTPLISHAQTKDIPEYVMYYPHLITGIIPGNRGAAEYELITGKPGLAVAGMDAMSMIILVVIGFLVLGNAIYFTERRKNSRS